MFQFPLSRWWKGEGLWVLVTGEPSRREPPAALGLLYLPLQTCRSVREGLKKHHRSTFQFKAFVFI